MVPQDAKRVIQAIVLALVSIAAVGCYPLSSAVSQAQVSVAPNAPFDDYQAFSFGLTEEPSTRDEASARSLEVEHRLRDLIGAEFAQRGYVEENKNPGFVVRFGTSTQRLRSQGFDQNDRMESDDDGYAYFREIKLDVFDAAAKTAVWRSSIVSSVSPDEATDDDLIRSDVKKLLATFPERPRAVDQCGRPLASPPSHHAAPAAPVGTAPHDGQTRVAPTAPRDPDGSGLAPEEVRIE